MKFNLFISGDVKGLFKKWEKTYLHMH